MSDEHKSDSEPEDLQNLVISRGERPEITTKLEDVQDMTVVDEWGRKVRFGDFYMHQKTIIVFLRHFLCFACKEYVDDLAIVPKSYLDKANVRLVVIGCSPYKFIQQFRETTGYQGELYVDVERGIYSKLGLRREMRTAKVKESRHVKSGFMAGVFKSMWRGMKYCEFQGDMHQQGGAFICGPGPMIHFSHVDINPTDHCPINDLLIKSDVEYVNFAKDARVLSL